ncbi:MAG: TGS domain-containing protein [SAR324 cluster bacterium]|nr:TGS domain-containing protein [SAR324 cluster bacterium]
MIRIESIISDFQAYTKGVIDCTPIQKAYILAVKHFSQAFLPGQGRLEMALDRVGTLIELEMDIQSIVAALLLDVHRIEKVSKADLIDQIGKETFELIEQTASIMALSEKAAKPDQVAESLRQLVRATITDLRTLLLTLAARKAQLLGKAGLLKQRLKILSKEALEIYSPIAERLGLNHLRVQLEDLSFSILHPKEAEEIQTYLKRNFEAQDSLLGQFKNTVTEKLAKYQPPVVINSRIKHGYSLFKKSKMTKVDYNHVHDLLGLRILVDSVDTAYKVLGVLNNTFHPVNDRYKNYISFPKPNGYQSLHAFVIDDSGTGFDVQIRTHEMHSMAEMGIASHWSYKASELGTRDKESLNWLEDLSGKLKVTEDPQEALDLFSRELYTDQVYVFTPKGKILKLPLGASVIDFAYEIHSEIGDHCTGALINGVHKNLQTPLHQGDKIEIITAANQEPKPEWLLLAKTNKALNHTRAFLRKREHQEAHALGLEIFTEQIKSMGQNQKILANSEAFQDFLKKSNHKNLENYK